MVICGLSGPVRGLRRAACAQQREGAGSAEAHAPAGAAAAMLPVSQVLAQQALAVSSGQPAVQEQNPGEYHCGLDVHAPALPPPILGHRVQRRSARSWQFAVTVHGHVGSKDYADSLLPFHMALRM